MILISHKRRDSALFGDGSNITFGEFNGKLQQIRIDICVGCVDIITITGDIKQTKISSSQKLNVKFDEINRIQCFFNHVKAENQSFPRILETLNLVHFLQNYCQFELVYTLSLSRLLLFGDFFCCCKQYISCQL